MAQEETQLVLGRGEVYFEPFLPNTLAGEGEIYIGNTTTFQIGRTLERVDRFTSYGGQKIELPGVVISENYSVTFITDSISLANIGLWHGGDPSVSSDDAEDGLSETLTVKTGRYYQLARRSIESVVVKISGDVVPMEGNYYLDKESGRIGIIAGADDIPTGSTITVSYEGRFIRTRKVSSEAKQTIGALRYIATNPYGVKDHYFFPYVRLAPRGQVDLKGDEWQQIPFDVQVMRLNRTTDQLYIDGTYLVGMSLDEITIRDIGGLGLSQFQNYEDTLSRLVNVTMPRHNYDG